MRYDPTILNALFCCLGYHNHLAFHCAFFQKEMTALQKQCCDLYAEGKSVKQVGRIIGKSHALVFKYVKRFGFLRPKEQWIKLRYGASQIDIHLARAFKAELKSFSVGDELTHWSNHPEAKKANSLANYYKNHEQNHSSPKRQKGRNVHFARPASKFIIARLFVIIIVLLV